MSRCRGADLRPGQRHPPLYQQRHHPQTPTDPGARIAKMKDGSTHLADKSEHTVDLDSRIVVAAVNALITRLEHDIVAL